MKVLMVSVGGSDAQILISIEHNKPDYVVFLCTEDDETGTKGGLSSINGEGLVCRSNACKQCGYKIEDRKNIVSRMQLKDGDYELIAVETDNPFDWVKTNLGDCPGKEGE